MLAGCEHFWILDASERLLDGVPPIGRPAGYRTGYALWAIGKDYLTWVRDFTWALKASCCNKFSNVRCMR